MWRALCLVSLVGSGCVTPATLERSAMRHELKAEQLAQIGDGAGAANERWRAASDRNTAQIIGLQRSNQFVRGVPLF